MNESGSSETLYDCVQSLLAAEPRAQEYFLTLPEDAQGHINLHADSVCSYERLKRFAESFSHN